MPAQFTGGTSHDVSASAVTTHGESGREATTTIYFRKEGGEWKYCLTDSPEMQKIQQLPGMK